MKHTTPLAIIALLLAGCASSGTPAPDAAASAAPEATGATASTESASGAASDSASAAAATAAAPADIPDACRTPIASYIHKFDGTVEVATAGTLFRIDAKGNAAPAQKLSDDAAQYRLLPQSNSIIHLHPDHIGLEDLGGKEIFRLEGDPTAPDIAFNCDATELVIRMNARKFNVWNTEKGFGAIAANERVQDFVNRQKPDHFLSFPGDVSALSVGIEGHVAIAMDDPASGKTGLLYHLDSVGAPGKLQVIARTNTHVRAITISPNFDSVSAIDENGQLFSAGTDKKGFYGFSKDYAGVTQVVYHGSNPVIVQPDRLTQIDIASGTPIFEIQAAYDACSIVKHSLYCMGNGALDIRDAYTGDLLHRYGFASSDASCHLHLQ